MKSINFEKNLNIKLFNQSNYPKYPKVMKNNNSTANILSSNKMANELKLHQPSSSNEKNKMINLYDDFTLKNNGSKTTSNQSKMILPKINKEKLQKILKKNNNNSPEIINKNKRLIHDTTSYPIKPKKNISNFMVNQESKDHSISNHSPISFKGTFRSGLQTFMNFKENNNNNNNDSISNGELRPLIIKKNFLKKVYSSILPKKPILKDNKRGISIETKDNFQSKSQEEKITIHKFKGKGPETPIQHKFKGSNTPKSHLPVKLSYKIPDSPLSVKTDKSNQRYGTFSEDKLKDLIHANFSPEIIQKELLKQYCSKSQAGTRENKVPKINQDTYLVMTSINNVINFNLFAVFDGHGINGHLVSEFVKHYFKNAIENHEKLKLLKSIKEIYLKLKEKNYFIIRNIFKTAEKYLSTSHFDCKFSGTTAVVIFQTGLQIICANVGDSRAIMIKTNKENNQKCQTTLLSFDQKPNNAKEKKRIVKAGGIVERYSEFGVKGGPFRVWDKNQLYPGLAMSRSIGDLVASSIGVICDPEIIEHELSMSSQYLIIASDGLWEFMENNKVMITSKDFYENNDAEGLCTRLISEATKHWEKEETIIDDITVVTAFF